MLFILSKSRFFESRTSASQRQARVAHYLLTGQTMLTDTQPDAEAVQFELLRRMTSAQKFEKRVPSQTRGSSRHAEQFNDGSPKRLRARLI